MNPSWKLPPELEKPFRKALDHASKRRDSELRSMMEETTDDQIAGGIWLCGLVTAYVAIDVVNREWPTDAVLRRMAESMTKGGNRDEEFGVTAENVYRYVSQVALGFKDYADVFNGVFDDAYRLLAAPFFITVHVLASYCPKGQTIWEFLEQIESAYEGAWLLNLNMLPALMVRARMPQPDQGHGESD